MRRCTRFFCIIMPITLAAWMVVPSAAQNARPLPPVGPAPGDRIPNLNGVWDPQSIRTEAQIRQQLGGNLPPFTPHGLEKYENRDPAADPTGLCQPSGTGRVFHTPFPFQILQSDGQVTFLFEAYHAYHRVFTDGRPHPKPLDITWWGYSVGRYEGNKLIFETIGMDPRTWLFTEGLEHSDKLKLTHVFEKTGPDTIRVTETYDDPVFFTKPWSISYELRRLPFDNGFRIRNQHSPIPIWNNLLQSALSMTFSRTLVSIRLPRNPFDSADYDA
jgi:hypothetical protein